MSVIKDLLWLFLLNAALLDVVSPNLHEIYSFRGAVNKKTTPIISLGILVVDRVLFILPTAFKKTVQNAGIIKAENREKKTNPRKSE